MAEPARKIGPMDDAHAQDWSVLDLGHPAVSQRTIYLVDLKVDVWGVDEIAGSSLPVTCIVSIRMVPQLRRLKREANSRFSRTAGRTKPGTWSRWQLVCWASSDDLTPNKADGNVM